MMTSSRRDVSDWDISPAVAQQRFIVSNMRQGRRSDATLPAIACEHQLIPGWLFA